MDGGVSETPLRCNQRGLATRLHKTMRKVRSRILLVAALLVPAAILTAQQQQSQQQTRPAAPAVVQQPALVQPGEPDKAEAQPAGEPEKTDDEASEEASTPGSQPAAQNRALNLAGQTDTAKGEARRNENVQVNMVDNNGARELNRRMGITATAVEEFRGDRGYFGSEFGNPPRTQVHVPAQAGTGFHGNLFWGHNNSIFSARSFFQAGQVKPARENQYGSAFGIQPWHGAFFSFNGSQEKNRGNVNGNVLIPLPAERTPLATNPAIRALVQRAIDGYPNVAPNRPDIAARSLNTNAPQTIDTDSVSGQLSQKLRNKETLTGRYAFTAQKIDAFQFIQGANPNTRNKSHTARVSWNRPLGDHAVLDVSTGFDRQAVALSAVSGTPITTIVTGLNLLGPIPTIPINRRQNRFRYAASVNSQRGRHSLSAGLAGTRLQFNGTEDEVSLGIYQYRNDFGNDAITNFRLGTPSSYTVALGTTYRAFRNWELQGYASDRWAVNSALNVNFSVRWEPVTRPIDVSGRGTLLFDSDWNNVAPSTGFALRLPKKAGTIRAAYGILFGQIYPATFGFERGEPTTVFRVTVQAPSLINPLAGINLNNLKNTPASDSVVSPDLATPYSQQYNFTWERELGHDWKLQLAYIGSRSLKLFGTFVQNRAQPIAGLPFTTTNVNDRRANPRKQEVAEVNNTSRGYYDAGRATLTVPRWHKLSLTVSYWFSKAIDLGGDYNTTGSGPETRRSGHQFEFENHRDLKSLSAFDQPHALLVQGNYDLPHLSGRIGSALTRGWSINGVGLMKNGTPFVVDSGSDGPGFGNVDGTVGDRPYLLDPTILGRTIGNPDTSRQLLPRSAFRFINAPTELSGNLGRNVFRRGKIANINASLSRTWKLPRDWQATLRAESINFLNTPQFAEPGFSLTGTNFGQITNTLNDGRTFRFQLRLNF